MSIVEKIAFLKNDLKNIDCLVIEGQNTQIQSGTMGSAQESLTEDGVAFSWALYGTNATYYIHHTSSNDTGKIATIEYLDSGFNRQEAIVTLGAPYVSTNTFGTDVRRINKVTLNSAASSTVTVKNNYQGAANDIYVISAGQTTSRHGIFSVPRGEKYALLAIDHLSDYYNPSNADRDDAVTTVARSRVCDIDGTLPTGNQFFRNDAGCSSTHLAQNAYHELHVPMVYEEGTDIELIVKKHMNESSTNICYARMYLAKLNR